MTDTFAVGDLVDGKYRILRLIGEGGWGIVFEGENARTLKRVAIKVLRTQANITADIQARFEREAQAAGRIGSEHIVEVFDLGTLADGTSYMVMELLAGEELSARVRAAGKLEPIVAVKLVVQLLVGLGAAHAAGILHRDLKPENLFLVPTRTGEDFVKILDFGISKFANTPVVSATMTGAVLGSPFYMAPEQARGLKQIDARTDLYAVGTVLYECITGRVPFEGDNFNDLMFKIVLAQRPNPLDFVPDLDLDLATIVLKAISALPADRYQTADEFRVALATWLESKGVASVRAPELRRAFNMTQTPRTQPNGLSDRAVKLTPADAQTRRETSWSDATVAMPESVVGKDTPVASSSTLEPHRSGRKRVMILGALLVLCVVGGLSLKRLRTHESAASDSMASLTPPTPTAAPSPQPTSIPTEPAVVSVPAATVAAPTVTASAQADVDDPTNAQAQSLHAHGSARNGHASRNTKDAGATAVAAPAAEAPKPASAPAATAKPADTVEGREIRTNL